MLDKPLYIAAYHQSPFGKLKELIVHEKTRHRNSSQGKSLKQRLESR